MSLSYVEVIIYSCPNLDGILVMKEDVCDFCLSVHALGSIMYIHKYIHHQIFKMSGSFISYN